jgi:hypothetical protein
MVKANKNGHSVFTCPKCSDHHTIAGKWGFREHLRRVHGMSEAAATKLRNKMMRRAGKPPKPHARILKVRTPKQALLTLTRSRQWTDKMVYILAANKFHKYRNGRSRILYIGTTKKGADRPAASAVNKASEAFYKLRGVKTIDVHIVTCAPRKAMQTWKRLESALLDVFRNKYFQLPRYNKVRPTMREGLFSIKALDKIISNFHVD